MSLKKVTGIIVNKAFQVHKSLGPGLLESTYQQCLAFELIQEGLKVELEKPIPLVYRDVKLDCGFRLDMLVEDSVIVETKTVDSIAPIHVAQLLTYLRLTNLTVGLLLNFHVTDMKEGIKRVVNNYQE